MSAHSSPPVRYSSRAGGTPTCVHCRGKSGHPVIWRDSRHELQGEYDGMAATSFLAWCGLSQTRARSVNVCYPCLMRQTRRAVEAVEHGQDVDSEAIIEERVSGMDPESRDRIRDRLMTFSREASAMRHRVFHPRAIAGCYLCGRAAS